MVEDFADRFEHLRAYSTAGVRPDCGITLAIYVRSNINGHISGQGVRDSEGAPLKVGDDVADAKRGVAVQHLGVVDLVRQGT